MHTLSLCIPLEFYDNVHACLKLEHSLDEYLQMNAHDSTYEKPHLSKSSHIHYMQMDNQLHAYEPFEMLILSSHFSTLMTITP
jgi:hypothetical protein